MKAKVLKHALKIENKQTSQLALNGLKMPVTKKKNLAIFLSTMLVSDFFPSHGVFMDRHRDGGITPASGHCIF